MCNNFNNSVVSSNFPHCLKLTGITASYTLRTIKENYRPVSILTKSTTIFEKIVFTQMTMLFEIIFYRYQCGFKKNDNIIFLKLQLKHGNLVIALADFVGHMIETLVFSDLFLIIMTKNI